MNVPRGFDENLIKFLMVVLRTDVKKFLAHKKTINFFKIQKFYPIIMKVGQNNQFISK